jgi:two-component system sensor histidine kinase and response regulator WspE
LYRTVLAGRLRPFSDGVTGITRLVRDTARDLGKQVRLDIQGEGTRVDRDILEKLEAPISHLVTNAVDHGIETPAQRIAARKSPEARVRIYARHENGRLVISVRDDGGGIHPEHLRERIVARNLVTQETAAGLSNDELLEFLFLPGFSTREAANTVSGRGVGLNVVQSMVQEAGGSVVVTSDPGVGTVFRMTLPVTRSVVKVLRVQVEGELYAVPLVRIDRVARMEPAIPVEELDAPTFVPLAEPTVDFDGHALCNWPRCWGFRAVRCLRARYRCCCAEASRSQWTGWWMRLSCRCGVWTLAWARFPGFRPRRSMRTARRC